MVTIILLAPLLGAVLCGFGYRWLSEKGALVTATGLLFLACLLSWIVFLTFDGVTRSEPLFRWIVSGTLASDWGVRLDRLTAIMLVVVTTVSAFVHLYWFGYMDHDENFKPGESYKPRFFAYLSFFTFAMLALVTADNLLQLFFGWEGVGRRLVPADRLLLSQGERERRRDQGVHRQPHRRLRLPARHLRALRAGRLRSTSPTSSPPPRRWPRARCASSGATGTPPR